MAEMTLPPLDTPIAHNGSPECPVHPETTVRCGGITWNAWDVFWPDVTTYTIIARAPADRIAELEAALEAVIDEYDLDQDGQKYHSIDRAREALK